MAATRASDADRDACLEEIESAFADGRINDLERESRTQSALQATTLDQLERLTADLTRQPTASHRTASRTGAGKPPGPGTRSGLTARFTTGQLRALLLGAIALAMVAIYSLLFVLGTVNDDGPATGNQADAGLKGSLLTAGGFTRFVDLTREEFGTTVVDSASVYGDQVSVQIIRKDAPRRTERWSYSAADGYDDEPGSKGARTADDPTVDIADIDTASYARAITRAPAVLGVEDITSLYVSIGDYSGRPAYAVYVSNEYSETGYWTFTPAGEEISRYAFE